MLNFVEVFGEEMKNFREATAFENMRDLQAKITILHEVFNALNFWNGFPALVIVGTHFVSLTMTVFIAVSALVLNLQVENKYFVVLYLFLFGYVYKLVLIMNAGHKLRRQAVEMQTVILGIPESKALVGEEQDTLRTIQKLVGSTAFKFQLTACDFFKLNRATLISVRKVNLGYLKDSNLGILDFVVVWSRMFIQHCHRPVSSIFRKLGIQAGGDQC
jgi:hypothetical protein